jgi:predicted dithiol-disulfide oxidoreductase (DUF899 family)
MPPIAGFTFAAQRTCPPESCSLAPRLKENLSNNQLIKNEKKVLRTKKTLKKIRRNCPSKAIMLKYSNETIF